MPQEYKLSGEIGDAGLKVPLGLLAVVSVPMALDGLVDAHLGHFMGVGLITMLASVLVSGTALGFLARWSHCRSPKFLLKAATIVAVLSYGVNWSAFLSAQPGLGDHGLLAYLLNPLNAFTGIKFMMTTETYTWFGWSPPIALRVVGWLGELVIWVLFCGVWASRNALNRKLYCERCRCFAVPEEPETFISLTEDAAHREAVMSAEFLSTDLKVERVGPSFPASFALCLQRCRGCSDSVGLYLSLRTLSSGDTVRLQEVSPLYTLGAKELKKLGRIGKQVEWKGKSG